LSYGYNLSGELTSITNPTGPQGSYTVGYNCDKTGRMTAVSGSGYATVSSYASNLSYRAFGGLKSQTFGDTLTQTVGYDNRLRVKDWGGG
jgi:YD repeat-containing protein